MKETIWELVLQERLDKLQPKAKTIDFLHSVIQRQSIPIDTALAKGYTYKEIAQIFTEQGKLTGFDIICDELILKRCHQIHKKQNVLRIFLCGFPKSGTTSLTKAFRSIGWQSAHWIIQEKKYIGQLIYQAVDEGKPPLEYLKNYKCITQADVCLPPKINYWPQLDMSIIAQIYKYYPECIFILNTRSVDAIISSIDRWTNFRKRLIKSEIPGLPRGLGSKDSELREWIEGHYNKMRTFFKGSSRFIEFKIDHDDISKLNNKLGVSFKWWGVANKGIPEELLIQEGRSEEAISPTSQAIQLNTDRVPAPSQLT